MNLVLFVLYEIYWYGLWWLPLVAIAYGSARYLGWFGIIGAIFLISMMIVFIDVHWIFEDMREHPENGRDADFVFWFGVLCRIVIFNAVLIPASIFGMRHRARNRAAEESDFGRRFGWFIEKNGERIGELDYLRWDSDGQFWHEYRVSWRKPEDAVVGPDAWIEAKLVLRNRRYTDVVIDSFLTSPERGDSVIAVRNAYVPEKRL